MYKLEVYLCLNRLSIDQTTMFHLIVTRNRRDLLLFFARISGDYHRVISMLVTEQKYTEAISVIASAPFEKTSTFIYEVAPILIEQEPEATIEMLLSKPQLSVGLLLPTLLRYAALLDRKDERVLEDKTNHAVTFFEELLSRAGLQVYQYEQYGPWLEPKVERDIWSTANIEPVAIHCMVWLLAKYESPATEDKLCSFIGQLFELKESGLLHPVVAIDTDYILRQCRAFHRQKSTIFALLLNGQTEAAAKMALKFDLDLAKAIANHQHENDAKRMVWTLIAEHTIANVSEMKTAINLIQESGNILTIQDLLPMLPEFTEIDTIKEEICCSLEECGTRINDIKTSMRHLADSVENTLQVTNQ